MRCLSISEKILQKHNKIIFIVPPCTPRVPKVRGTMSPSHSPVALPMPANLLCELNGHLMPCFYGKWVEEVCAGQFGVFVYLVLGALLRQDSPCSPRASTALLIDNLPHLKYETTVPCTSSLITTLIGDCRSFSVINVPQNSVVTHIRCSGIFNKYFAANLPLNLTV